MADIFTYLFWRRDLSFAQDGLNEVDGMIFARLSYLPWERIAERVSEPMPALGEAAQVLLDLSEQEDLGIMRDELRLLRELTQSHRFRGVKLLAYETRSEEDAQVQFAAVTFRIRHDLYYLSFRGTDGTFVGWKEDFNMSFLCPVPAQKLATEYLERIAREINGGIVTGGHSKGGNLAVYAAAFCSEGVQRRIERVYNYDGPGFDKKVLETPGYQAVSGRIETFVPQSSVVGMLLEHEESYTIVHSRQNVGILQHDTYSWDIEGERFVHLKTVTDSSKFVDFTLKHWLAELDSSQREVFADSLYRILTDTGAKSFRELNGNWFSGARSVLKSLKNMDDDTQRMIARMLLLLVESAQKGMLYSMLDRVGANGGQ